MPGWGPAAIVTGIVVAALLLFVVSGWSFYVWAKNTGPNRK